MKSSLNTTVGLLLKDIIDVSDDVSHLLIVKVSIARLGRIKGGKLKKAVLIS